ncbi:MAG: DeoR family transcriptional regulator [Patescibacteria group bacterium]
MNRDFFIRLTFAIHRIADAFQGQLKQEMKNSANIILADLILLSEKEGVLRERKRGFVTQILRELQTLEMCFRRAKREGLVDPTNFSMLQAEYGKIKDLLEVVAEIEGQPIEAKKEEAFEEREEVAKETKEAKEEEEEKIVKEELRLSERQEKILEFLRAKRKVQVWELQKVLPQVTKRTLRRDLDDLLQMDFIQRKGEWNAVFYELKENVVEKV